MTTEVRPLAIRAAIAGLNLVVGALILIRSRAQLHGSPASCMAGIPALIIAGWAIRIAPTDWPLQTQWLFLAGTLLAIASFVYLGRSFAILPAVRDIVTRGPYRFVRHPAYLGELLMILACCLAAQHVFSLGPILAAIPLVALRIHAEERVIATSESYTKYATQVRWRLVPLLW
ncbi:MAG: isoprenylcysteine carboxylmethyltransferase family protein [Planctomycetaceae bacterium]|nr:isoprenylcysteine carboxylmethyltransferase family protein [Planctomycetaceae bacterium]